MKRSWWILGAVILVILIAGGGVTWWLVASQQDGKTLTAADTADFVYTGEDLAGFLIDQQSAHEVMGSTIMMAAADNTFQTYSGPSVDPANCAVITGTPTMAPAGFREVHGGYIDGDGATGHALYLNQSIYQFATIDDAVDSFAQIENAWNSCADFVEIFREADMVSTPSSANFTGMNPDSGREDLVAAMISYTGGQEKTTAVVTMRINNVITSGKIVSSGPATGSSLDESTVRRLTAAIIAQVEKAEHAKAEGKIIEVKPPPVWEIDFDSIGPININMTAQQASDIMGDSGPLWVDMDFCSTYFLGTHNESVIGGLAESQGATGHLDSISVSSDWRTDFADATDLPAYRPRTAAGISTGSTLSELKQAYPGQLELRPHQYIEGGHYGYVSGPQDTIIMFNVDENDVVTMIFTGRTPQAVYIEGCA